VYGSKLFSKIYNVFYCPKKAQEAPVVDEADLLGQLKSEWFDAVKEGDVVRLQELLDQKVDINTTDQHGWTGLHMASWNGNAQVCRALLSQRRCDINRSGPGGSTALTLAVQRGKEAIIDLLLQAECTVTSTIRLVDSQDVTALHLASKHGHTAVVKKLLAAGAVVDAPMVMKGVQGVTPLHLAVEAGHMDIMDLLIDAGCNIHSSTQPTTETNC